MNDLPSTRDAETPFQEIPSSLKNILNFFFELGMLKKTPRTGYQFLGSGRESVADHSFRMALIGYTLARLSPGVDPHRVVCMCLFHDVSEARTGDMNYVNKQYVTVDEDAAVEHLARTLPFGDEFMELFREYRQHETQESRLVHDADQLDLLLELKEQLDLGNAYARKWMDFALRRLVTDLGRKLGEALLTTDSTAWWFDGHDEWWNHSRGNPPSDG